MNDQHKPVVFHLEEGDAVSPEAAPPVPDDDTPAVHHDAAMHQAINLGGRRGPAMARWALGLLTAIAGFAISVSFYDYLDRLWLRNSTLGAIMTGLMAVFASLVFAVAVRELAAFARLRRIDHLQVKSVQAYRDHDLKQARRVRDEMLRFYEGRADTAWGRGKVRDLGDGILDADDLLGHLEQNLLAPLDARAAAEIELAARQVATVTAIVPLAFADVAAALGTNLRMIGQIARIYGGRSGALGTWRLTRTVFAHLVATGAVAVGDDLIGSVAGGGVVSRLSRRFGEGVVNGALTARVGIAAMEVCRPLEFVREQRPSVSAIVSRALAGLFSRKKPAT